MFEGVQLTEATLLRPQAGDTLILRHPGRLHMEQVEMLMEQWRAYVEGLGVPGLKALVLQEGMSVEVLRSEVA